MSANDAIQGGRDGCIFPQIRFGGGVLCRIGDGAGLGADAGTGAGRHADGRRRKRLRGLRSDQGGRLFQLDGHRRVAFLRDADAARRQGQPHSRAGAVDDGQRGRLGVGRQAAPGREVPRRHAVFGPVGGRSFQPPARSSQPLRRPGLPRHREGRGRRRADRGLQDARSQRGAAEDAGAAQRRHPDRFGQGRAGKGRRLQPQPGRHRPVRVQGMARGGPARRRALSPTIGTRPSPISTG